MPPRSLKEQLSSRCKHFNGIFDHIMCSAGVIYSTVRDSSKSAYEWPCTKPDCATHCEKRELPTAEEVAAEEAEIQASFERTVMARAAIVEHSKGAKGVHGSFWCPCCKVGKLNYSVAACNGHIHARCSTKACVSFME